jgi:hypothetical protein
MPRRLASLALAVAMIASCGGQHTPTGSSCSTEPASVQIVAGDGQEGTPGATLGETFGLPLVVHVRDFCTRPNGPNRPYDGGAVWRVDSGGGAIVASGPEEGRWTARWTLGAALGEQRATFEALDSNERPSGIKATFRATVVPGRGDCQDPVVFEDTFEQGDRWASDATSSSPAILHDAFPSSAGGSPGSYRRMRHVFPGPGSLTVFHSRGGASYEPQRDGRITSIRYSEDRTLFDPPFAGAAVAGGLLVQQAGRRVQAALATFRGTSWQRAEAVLSPSDLPGIDFSFAGSTISFGYYRANSVTTDRPADLAHGIDNWRVELCR